MFVARDAVISEEGVNKVLKCQLKTEVLFLIENCPELLQVTPSGHVLVLFSAP